MCPPPPSTLYLDGTPPPPTKTVQHTEAQKRTLAPPPPQTRTMVVVTKYRSGALMGLPRVRVLPQQGTGRPCPQTTVLLSPQKAKPDPWLEACAQTRVRKRAQCWVVSVRKCAPSPRPSMRKRAHFFLLTGKPLKCLFGTQCS